MHTDTPPPGRSATAPSTLSRDERAALELARWLDDRFLDPALGLVLPGVGDFLTAGLGAYIVFLGIRKRLPAPVIARMLVNLGLDALLGIVPIAGDIADFVVRANRRNAELLVSRAPRTRARVADWLVVAAAVLVVIAALSLPVLLVVFGLRALGERSQAR